MPESTLFSNDLRPDLSTAASMPERSWQSFGGDLIMEKERLPETSPVAAAVSPGGKATASKPGEGEIWQISQLRAKTSKAAWTDNTVMGESLERFQNLEMRNRKQSLQSETFIPKRENPSLNPLQQRGNWVPQQVADPRPLNLPQPIEALQCLGVVQKPGNQQLGGEQPQQGGWPQPPNVQPRDINLQPGWGLQQLGWPQERWGAQQEACQTLPLPARDPNPEERVSSSLRHLQQWVDGFPQQMNDQQQQRAPPPPAVQQQRRPLQPPLAQPPLGGLQQQGVPSNPAGQQPWNQPQWGPQQPVFAPLFNATFDGDPEKLIFFLNQVRSHLNRWAYLYPEPGAMVDVIGANLEGNYSTWYNGRDIHCLKPPG